MTLLAMAAALCFADAPPISLTEGRFTLEWTHSVERVHWREVWQLRPEGLALISAKVKGSGAGMEAGPDAVLQDGWWRWDISPPLVLDELVLGASGATGAGWTLCDPDLPGSCREIGADAGAAIRLYPCGGGVGSGASLSGG